MRSYWDAAHAALPLGGRTMTRLIRGPADGRDIPAAVTADRSEIYVAILDNRARILPARHTPDLEDLLNRVGMGGWDLYRREPTDPVTYQHVNPEH
jgi:hypothetical protein